MNSQLIEFPIGNANDTCRACGEPKANLVIVGEVRVYACKCGHRWDAPNSRGWHFSGEFLKTGWHAAVAKGLRDQVREATEKLLRDAFLKGSR